jgi:hypothetical protein
LVLLNRWWAEEDARMEERQVSLWEIQGAVAAVSPTQRPGTFQRFLKRSEQE